jgi:hypothetical protein
MRHATLLLVLAGCTSLGPNPATTGIGARPLARPGFELGVALVPGHFLSAGVTEDPEGTSIQQASLTFEPDRLIDLPGAFVAARLAGDDESGVILEPALGYRRALDDRFAVAGLAFGTRSSKERRGASYEAMRFGGELAADVRLTPVSRILELHLFGGAALTWLEADGRYCINPETGFGIDCPEEASEPRTMANADVTGVYPTGHVGGAVELGRGLRSAFRGARLALSVAGGWMPTLVAGQKGRHSFAALGLSLSVALGSVE